YEVAKVNFIELINNEKEKDVNDMEVVAEMADDFIKRLKVKDMVNLCEDGRCIEFIPFLIFHAYKIKYGMIKDFCETGESVMVDLNKYE
ncbi:hypothetical protein DKP78_20060, partial [Enterococcus faecium]